MNSTLKSVTQRIQDCDADTESNLGLNEVRPTKYYLDPSAARKFCIGRIEILR
jgi:hypothetical protein